MALSKQADHPAANSCSGLVPGREEPGDESLTSSWPSLLREAPSRPPVVWVLPVYRTFSTWVIVISFLNTARRATSALAMCGRCREIWGRPGWERILVLWETLFRVTIEWQVHNRSSPAPDVRWPLVTKAQASSGLIVDGRNLGP